MAILLQCVERAFRSVDWQMREVRPAQAFELSIKIGEIPALQQRIVAEVNPGHNILRAESRLLCLREEVVDAAVQHQTSYAADWHLFFGDNLRGIQHVEREILSKLLIEELQAKFPLGKV